MYRWNVFSVLALAALLFFVDLPEVEAADWESIGVTDGVAVSRMHVRGSSVFAFRGEIVADVHISKIMEVFTNPNQRRHWVDRYHSHETLEQTRLHELYWIRFSLPPGISDRDYLLRADLEIDEGKKVVTARIRSVVDNRWPEQDCCVRATTQTFYEFTALDNNRTRMIVEVHTDPMGRLPSWLVNRIQRGWPSTTLSNLYARAQADSIRNHADYRNW